MARLTLNKSVLARETEALATYRRHLPALDLKRRQLIAERAKAVRELARTRQHIEQLRRTVAAELAMLANENVGLGDLVAVQDVQFSEQNLLGARLPVLQKVAIKVKDYSFLAKPHWVDTVAARLKEMLALRVQAQVEERRVALLDAAVRRITQRVNLFDKVLIPRARDNIQRIKVYLADSERAAVVRAKLAKAKRTREAAA